MKHTHTVKTRSGRCYEIDAASLLMAPTGAVTPYKSVDGKIIAIWLKGAGA